MGLYNGTTSFSDPGNSTATALNTATYIGGSLLSTNSLFQDDLTSGSDVSDYYKFTLSSSSIVTFNLTGLQAGSNADLSLLDSSGNLLKSSTNTGNTSEAIRYSLNNQAPNTYYIQVSLVSGSASITYDLTLAAEAIQESGISDNTTTLANTNRDISAAVNSGSFTTTDFVGTLGRGLVVDSSDYYKFTLNNTGSIAINLTPSSGNANLVLSGSNLSSPLNSSLSGTNPDIINTPLSAGTYYIQVSPSADLTNYTLQVNFTADPPDQGGNTLATSSSISVPTNISDLVSTVDTQDYYQFTLNSSALVDIKFTSLSADANLSLRAQNGNEIQSSSQTGTTLDFVRRSLNAGTYNILVTRGISATVANYTLSVASNNIAADQAGNDLPSSQNLGNLNGSRLLSDFVGNIDTDDYYKFTVNFQSTFNLNLTILSSYADSQLVNADVQLLNSLNQQIAISNQPGNNNESISNFTLNPGTYYLRVYTSGLANTFYNLDISAQRQIQQLEINVGAGSSNPDNLTALGNDLYFTANNGMNGVQLWKSNGNTNTLITNTSGFNPANLTVFNNKLYFTATNPTYGRELWEYNGTSLSRISDVNPNSGNANPANLTVVGSQLFFSAVDGSNTRKLWVYNGTTVSLVNINPGFDSNNLPTFIAFNNKLFFTATNNTQLWSTDGTVGNTQVISIGGVTNSYAKRLTVAGSTLYFTAKDATSGHEVWKYTTGTTASLVKDITPGNNSYAPEYLTAVGNTLYFVTDSDNDFNLELWKSDGTTNGTVRVNNNGQAPNIGFGSFSLTAVGNTLYFVGNDPVTGLELWKTDTSTTVATLVKDIWTGSDENTPPLPNNSLPTSLVNFNGTLAFAASDDTNRELWFSDGTPNNTQKVSNINASGNANPSKLTVVGTQLFFTADNGVNGTELYVM